jgi:hypothetical protein
VTIVRERLAVSKRRSHSFHTERFSLRKLKKLEEKGQYHVQMSNTCAAFENVDVNVDITNAWKTMMENISVSAKDNGSYYELNWFDKGCS